LTGGNAVTGFAVPKPYKEYTAIQILQHRTDR
jgi:hypothetical protein